MSLLATGDVEFKILAVDQGPVLLLGARFEDLDFVGGMVNVVVWIEVGKKGSSKGRAKTVKDD